MRIVMTLFLTLSLSAAAETASAERYCLDPREDSPTVALVLGGGGARGSAHIGAIRALEELRVPVDYIAGTSMGALIGGMMASGMDSHDLEQVLTGIDWSNVFKDDLPRQERPFRRKRDDDLGLFGPKVGLTRDGSMLPKAAVAGQKIQFLLETLVGQRSRTDHFDYLPIPFRAVAVDILTAETVVIEDGPLATAMRSSMAIPAFFDPVDTGDHLLVDGGVLMNLPISVGKDMGADVIIAIDVGSPLEPKEKVKNLFQILYQLTGVVTVVNTRRQIDLLGPDDFLLVPDIRSDIGSGSFAQAAEAIPAGYEEVMSQRDRLSRLSLSEAAWSERRTRIAACVEGPPIIEFVRIDNHSRFRDEVIERRLTIQPGDALDVAQLERDVQAIYSLGFLQSVHYRVVEEGDRSGLVVEVQQDSRGADFLEYGFGLSSTQRASDFVLRTGYLKADVDDLGSEFRALLQIGRDFGAKAELYKPLGPSLRWIFLPVVAGEESKFTEYDDSGNQLRQFRVRQVLADLSLGREFGNDTAIFAGLRFGRGNVDIDIGDPAFQPIDFDTGEYFFRGHYDSVDDRYFPGSGAVGKLRIRASDASLGASQEFGQLETALFGAWTVDRHTFFAGAEFDTSSDDPIPLQNIYRAGGFPRLSGFSYDELLGEHFAMVLGGYRYKLLENSFFPGYVGGTIEYGNVAQRRSELGSNALLNGSLYLGFDSLIGPIYLGAGFAEGGRTVGFFTIGSIFVRDSLIR